MREKLTRLTDDPSDRLRSRGFFAEAPELLPPLFVVVDDEAAAEVVLLPIDRLLVLLLLPPFRERLERACDREAELVLARSLFCPPETPADDAEAGGG